MNRPGIYNVEVEEEGQRKGFSSLVKQCQLVQYTL